MKVFDIPYLLEAIADDIRDGREPDPAKVNLLIQDGPGAVEDWLDVITETEAVVEVLAVRIKELQDRKAAREHTAQRMKDLLSDILANHFDGKLKTAQVTVWNQESVSYEFANVPDEYLVTPEPKVDKKRLATDYKAGALPKGIEVTETTKRSLRVRR